MVKQLQQMSQNSTTMLQAVQAGNQIAAQQALELEKLRQLIMMDLTSKQTFQAEQTQKAMSNQDLQDHFFADPDNGQYDRTTY
jgi:P-type conjugative transfer protein TrbJ